MFVGPLVDGFEGGDEAAAAIGEGVFDCRRYSAVLLAGDELVLFEFSQAFGQHGRRDADDFALELTVSEGLVFRVCDVPKDRQLPFLAEKL